MHRERAPLPSLGRQGEGGLRGRLQASQPPDHDSRGTLLLRPVKSQRAGERRRAQLQKGRRLRRAPAKAEDAVMFGVVPAEIELMRVALAIQPKKVPSQREVWAVDLVIGMRGRKMPP